MKNYLNGITIFNVFLVCLAFIMISVALIHNGPGINEDAAYYLAAAKNLDQENHLRVPVVYWNGLEYYHMEHWPPLFPIILSLGARIFNTTPLFFGCFLNIFLYVLINILVFLIIKNCLKSYFYAFLGYILILANPNILKASFFILTEPLFIVLSLLSFLILKKYLDSEDTKRKKIFFFLLSVIIAGCFATRYIGIVAVFSNLLVLFIFYPHSNYKHKIKRCILLSLPSLIFITYWVIRNIIVSHSLFGDRGFSQLSLLENFNLLSIVLIKWFSVTETMWYDFIFLLFMLFLNFIITIKRIGVEVRKIFVFCVLFLVTYMLFIVFTSSFIAMEKIGDRFLSPAYPFFVILIIILTKSFLDGLNRKQAFLSSSLFILIFFILVHNSFSKTILYLRNFYYNGAGKYAVHKWRDLDSLNFIKSSELTGKLYSNFAEGVYLYAGLNCKLVPSEKKDIPLFFEHSKQKDSYIIWFYYMNPSVNVTLVDLLHYGRLKTIASFKDGILFEVN